MGLTKTATPYLSQYPTGRKFHKEGRSACEFLSQNTQSRDFVLRILKRTGVCMCSREERLAVFCERMQGYGGKRWLQDATLGKREKFSMKQMSGTSNCR